MSSSPLEEKYQPKDNLSRSFVSAILVLYRIWFDPGSSTLIGLAKTAALRLRLVFGFHEERKRREQKRRRKKKEIFRSLRLRFRRAYTYINLFSR